MDIVLASASPRRLELLSRLGLEIIVNPAHIDEDIGIVDPQELVMELSERKANAVFDSSCLVLASDTVVVCDGQILGKPSGPDDAAQMWRMLSGRWHEVTSGYAILCPGGSRVINCVTSRILFKNLSDSEIQAYTACGEWTDKAGGYAIQGIAAFWIESIQGSYTNVMGLPLMEVARDIGILRPDLLPFPRRKV